MNNTVFEKAMKNLRNGIGVKLVNNKKDFLKCTQKSTQAICRTNYLTMI